MDPLNPKELDLSVIVEKVREQKGWSQEQAAQADLWYRRFLWLSQRDSKRDGKVRAVEGLAAAADALWHEHITVTAKYRQDCGGMFGAFLDHTPGKPPNWQTLFDNSMAEYIAEWGIKPPDATTCCY